MMHEPMQAAPERLKQPDAGTRSDPGEPKRLPASYSTRLAQALQLWKHARQARKHEDSIFIWIPKNAGTSVYTMLSQHGLVKLKTTRSIRLCFRNSGRVTFGHMAVQSLVELGLVSSDFVDRAFKFALVRDPYARAVSLYRFLSSIAILRNWNRPPTFREFLEIIANGHFDRIGPYNDLGLSQCNPQVAWLRDTPPDRIYKVEDLPEFIGDIEDRWKIPAGGMPHLNQSNPARQVALERQDEALIERIYAEDFEVLGYPKR